MRLTGGNQVMRMECSYQGGPGALLPLAKCEDTDTSLLPGIGISPAPNHADTLLLYFQPPDSEKYISIVHKMNWMEERVGRLWWKYLKSFHSLSVLGYFDPRIF